MNTKLPSLLLGLALIIIGALFFANNLRLLDGLPTAAWALIFAGSSALFLIAYFVRGTQAWGWLFPASIFAGLSGTLIISNSATADQWIPTLVVGSVAIPFIAAFLLDRSRTWALIPSFILAFVAFIPPMETLLGGEAVGAFVVAMIGVPFLVVHLISPKAWWGILPGGILLSIAAMIAVNHFINSDATVAIMFIGWMLTFGYVWLRLAKAWAKYPAVVMGVLACLMLLLSQGLETYWSIGLIVAGLVLIVLSLLPRHSPMMK